MNLLSVIRVYRKKHNITQEEFAKKVGISQPYLARIENEDLTPSPDVAIAIEKATKQEIKKEWLVFPKEYKKEIKDYIRSNKNK